MDESRKLFKELVVEEKIIFEEQSLTMHNSHYHKTNKKFQFERCAVKANSLWEQRLSL